MEVGHNETGIQWDHGTEGQEHNGTRTQQDWHIMGLGYDRTRAQQGYYTEILRHNGIGTQQVDPVKNILKVLFYSARKK